MIYRTFDVTGSQFLNKSQYVCDKQSTFGGLNFLSLISSYEKRFNPKLRMSHSHLIDDDYNQFIAYTLMMASVIKQVLNVDCCPLQVQNNLLFDVI